MADKFLSVKEAKDMPANFISAKELELGIEQLKNIILSQMGHYNPASNFSEIVEFNRVYEVRIEELISAVRREQDLIATKRERERAVKILCDSLDMHDCTKLVKGQSYATIKKKILEEK